VLNGIAMAQRTILVVALDEITVATAGGIIPRPVTHGICCPLVVLQITDPTKIVIAKIILMVLVLQP
jgi:hypothetical protein